jgi:hypothetical protein
MLQPREFSSERPAFLEWAVFIESFGMDINHPFLLIRERWDCFPTSHGDPPSLVTDLIASQF